MGVMNACHLTFITNHHHQKKEKEGMVGHSEMTDLQIDKIAAD